MKRNTPLPPDPTLWQALNNLLDAFINNLFSLRRGAGLCRFCLSLVVLLGAWSAIARYFNGGWPAYPLRENPKAFVVGWWGFFLNTHTIPALIALLLPYFVAREAAARYLDDVFELEDMQAAAHFIDSATFGIRYQTISIREGDIVRTDRNSPVWRIGGPGFVRVAVDSVILTERSDGRPRVIGPTVKGRKVRTELSGFERIRASYDLRDHALETRISARSLDGIPIEARDIRLIGSVWRKGQEPTLRTPYPFEPYAIHTLTYSRTARVSNNRGTTNLSVWYTQLRMIVQSALRDFINRTPLNEFLASISLPELEQQQDTKDEIESHGTLIRLDGEEASPVQPPQFTPRDHISGRMNRREDSPDMLQIFAQGFSAQAAKRGIELRWTGIGSWYHPDEIILEKHVDAWVLSRKNMLDAQPENIAFLRNMAYSDGIQSFLQKSLFKVSEDILQVRKVLGHMLVAIKTGWEDVSQYLGLPEYSVVERAKKLINWSLYIIINPDPDLGCEPEPRLKPKPVEKAEDVPPAAMNWPESREEKQQILERNLRQILGEDAFVELMRLLGQADPFHPDMFALLTLSKVLKICSENKPNLETAQMINCLRDQLKGTDHAA